MSLHYLAEMYYMLKKIDSYKIIILYLFLTYLNSNAILNQKQWCSGQSCWILFHSLTDLGQIQRMVLPYKPMTPGQYIMYVYGTALPETLKAPPEQETFLHNLIRIDLKVLTNRVCVCADDEFWRGSKGGESRRKLQAERGFR